jgi:hypothetical protein
MNSALRVKSYLKSALSEQQRQRLRRLQALRFRTLQHYLFRAFFGRNLRALARIYGTDKWGSHWYASHYETHFARLRLKRLNILEIGIGGYEDAEAGGDSLRMWRTYFPRSMVFGIDIYDKSLHDETRIKTIRGSQTDEYFLMRVLKEIGRADIIIDDGSHLNEHVIRTFQLLFPHLSEDGIYVIEDTQTSYWPSEGGSSADRISEATTMGFFKKLIDGLNHAEFQHDYQPTYFDKSITAMHFYHNLIFVQKGPNTERSNFEKSWSTAERGGEGQSPG